jgi:hypothetical protein
MYLLVIVPPSVSSFQTKHTRGFLSSFTRLRSCLYQIFLTADIRNCLVNTLFELSRPYSGWNSLLNP